MRDLGSQLRAYYDRVSKPTDPADVVAGRTRPIMTPEPVLTPWWRRPAIAAVAAAIATLLIVGGGALMLIDDDESVAEETTTTTTTAIYILESTWPGEWDRITGFTAGPTPPAAECDTDPDRQGPSDQRRPPYGGAMGQGAVFDAESGVIVYPGHDELWLFDVCSNTWAQGDLPGVEGRWGLVYDVDSDSVIGFDPEQDTVWVYDTNTGAVNEFDATGIAQTRPLTFYDPVSGLVFVAAPEMIHLYDVDTDTWLEHGEIDVLLHGTLRGYDVGTDRLVFGRSAFTKLVDPRTGDVYRAEARAPEAGGGFPPAFPLTATGTPGAVYLGTQDLAIMRFDASSDSWVAIYDPNQAPEGLRDRTFDGLVYDSINDRLIAFGGSIRVEIGDDELAWVMRDDVWAFDLEGGEPILLVPDSGKGEVYPIGG